MNPIKKPYTVGLTKLTFVQYFIVQNFKNSDNKIIVYKYLCLHIFCIFACMLISVLLARTKIFIINSSLE
jgi:hypothetical protein